MRKEDETKKYLNIIVSTSSIVLIGVVLSKLINYFYKIIIARGLGPEVYGLFSLGLIMVSIFSAFASLGLIDGVLRYVSFYRGKKQTERISTLVKTSVAITLVTSLLSALVLFLCADFIAIHIFHDPQLSYYLKILAFSVPLSVVSGVFLSVIRAFEKIGVFSFLVNVLYNLLKLGLLVVFIFVMSKTNAILFSYTLSFAGLLLAAYLFYVFKIRPTLHRQRVPKEKRQKIMWQTLSFSWPLIFTSLLSVLFVWTDSFFLGYYLDASHVGIYGSAVTLVGLFTIAQDLFMQLFLPIISKELARKNTETIQEISKQIFKWIAAINLPLFIAFVLFPEAIIHFFFGSTYIGAAGALRVLALGAFFSSFMSLFNGLMNMGGKTKTVLVAFTFFAILNAVLNIILVPLHGLEGAALATTITWCAFALCSAIIVKKAYGFYPMRRKVVRIVLVSLVPALLIYFISTRIPVTSPVLVLLGLIFAVVYFALIILTGCLDRHDLEIIQNLKDKLRSKVRARAEAPANK